MKRGGVRVLDLEHLGLEGAIGAGFIEHPEPALVDPGPATTLHSLGEGLRAFGATPGDIRHLFLTHVHLDHAGAAGHLVEHNPRITVHLHEEGAPHIADPERLVSSTRRTFGEAHDRLWGEVRPVPRDRIRAWRPGEAPGLPGVRPLATPGHIAHHLAWLVEGEGVLFAGDSLGIILDPELPTHPATPPPGVDLAAWRRTLTDTLAGLGVEAFVPTHFGIHTDMDARRRGLLRVLEALEARVARAMNEGAAAEEADRDAFHLESIANLSGPLSRERVERYFSTFSPRSDWDGVRFHLARRDRPAN